MIDRIIVSRTDSIGDVMLTLPMLGVLRGGMPRASIHFLGRSYTRPVLECCRHVDGILDWDQLADRSTRRRQEALRELDADAIIHVLPHKAIARLARRVRIPLRIGTARRTFHWTTCNARVRFSRRNSKRHEAQLNLELLRPLGMDHPFELAELVPLYGFENRHELPADLRALLRPDRFNLILHPRSQGSAVEWGLSNFRRLIEILPTERVEIFLTGTAAEGEAASELTGLDQPNLHSLFGRLGLGELIAFLDAADGIVAASTGPLHIAAALGKAALGLYSPRRPIHPGRWAPLGARAEYLLPEGIAAQASPAQQDSALAGIAPERVSRRVLDWLD